MNSAKNTLLLSHEEAPAPRARRGLTLVANHGTDAAEAYLADVIRRPLASALKVLLREVPARHRAEFTAGFLEGIELRLRELEQKAHKLRYFERREYPVTLMNQEISRLCSLAEQGALAARNESAQEALDDLANLKLGLAVMGLVAL